MSKLSIVGSVIMGDFSVVVFFSSVDNSDSSQDSGLIFSIITGGFRVVTFSGEDVAPLDDVELEGSFVLYSSVVGRKSIVVSNLFG